jgi:alpha-L-rhamnosidase
MKTKYDLIVVGGGFAGAAAAIEAARHGTDVLLIEKYNCLGGAAAFALVSPFMRYWTTMPQTKERKYLTGNLFLEMCDRALELTCEQNGEFSCADSTLNRINEMFLHTLRCNMHSGVLSDCPHRERLPYTGDGGVVMKSVCYNLSALDFYYKWFRDLLDAQHDNGLIPNTATHLGGGGGYAWGNALCVVTKELYALTGDLTVATEGYEAIKKWLNYYESKRDADYIIRSNSHNWLLGDWLAPEVVTSNVYYISTVCYLQAVKTALFLAEILEPAACRKWKDLQSSIADGINRVFFDR